MHIDESRPPCFPIPSQLEKISSNAAEHQKQAQHSPSPQRSRRSRDRYPEGRGERKRRIHAKLLIIIAPSNKPGFIYLAAGSLLTFHILSSHLSIFSDSISHPSIFLTNILYTGHYHMTLPLRPWRKCLPESVGEVISTRTTRLALLTSATSSISRRWLKSKIIHGNSKIRSVLTWLRRSLQGSHQPTTTASSSSAPENIYIPLQAQVKYQS